MLEVIGLSTWSWIQFRLHERYFLSVCCGSVGIFTVEVELGPAEVKRFKTEGASFIDELAAKIAYSPSQYGSPEARRLLNSPEAQEAVAIWNRRQ